MSKFLSKTIIFGSPVLRPSQLTRTIGILRYPNVVQLECLSSSSNQQSFTVSYLMNSLGFSPEAALKASRYVNFKTSENPDKVINLFKKHGFTEAQISKLVRVRPTVLSFDVEKTILPKLEFFEAKGVSGPEMAAGLSAFPNIFQRSLEKQIIPCYDFIRSLFQSDEIAISAFRRFPDILVHKIDKYVVPNIDILRRHGVPNYRIATLFRNRPKVFMVSSDRFRRVVEEVEEMGFDALRGTFISAVIVLRSMSKSIWQRKVDAYKKWGLSEEEILEAFVREPRFMRVSEDKLMACMDFFINQMGWRPCLIAKYPAILGWSLNKTVAPRCSVFQVLLSKGLVEKEVTFHELLSGPEEKFLQKFVVPYEEEAPELFKLYKNRLDLSSRPAKNLGVLGKFGKLMLVYNDLKNMLQKLWYMSCSKLFLLLPI